MNADSGMAYNYATGKIAILSQENAAVWVGTIVHALSFIYLPSFRKLECLSPFRPTTKYLLTGQLRCL